jgi:hypothetical protein
MSTVDIWKNSRLFSSFVSNGYLAICTIPAAIDTISAAYAYIYTLILAKNTEIAMIQIFLYTITNSQK